MSSVPTTGGMGRVLEHLFVRTEAKLRSSLVAGLINPAIFLGLLGVGLGSLVDEQQAAAGTSEFGAGGYLAFIGPGLLMISAVMWGFAQSLWPTSAALKWDKTYVLTASTPVAKSEIALAHVIWIVLRFAFAAVLFTLVLTVAGAVDSWWALLLPAAAGLTVASIATATCAFTVRQEGEDIFPMILRLAAIPMFLFSGAFFPLSEVPAAVAWLARLTPAWHGVELARDLTAGSVGWPSALHTAVLLAMVAAATMPLISGFERALDDA